MLNTKLKLLTNHRTLIYTAVSTSLRGATELHALTGSEIAILTNKLHMPTQTASKLSSTQPPAPTKWLQPTYSAPNDHPTLSTTLIPIEPICTMTIHYTVNGERFSGLNFRGFHPMKFFTGKVLRCLTFKALKQCHYTKLVYINKTSWKLLQYSWKPRKTWKFSPMVLPQAQPRCLISSLTTPYFLEGSTVVDHMMD